MFRFKKKHEPAQVTIRRNVEGRKLEARKSDQQDSEDLNKFDNEVCSLKQILINELGFRIDENTGACA
jgi:hypothetical protein